MGYKESQGITSRSIAYQVKSMFGWRHAQNYSRSDEKIAAGARLAIRVKSRQATFGEYAVLNYYDDSSKWNKCYEGASTEKWRVYSFKLVIRDKM